MSEQMCARLLCRQELLKCSLRVQAFPHRAPTQWSFKERSHPSEVWIKYFNFVLLAATCVSNWLESLSGPWHESSPWPVCFSSHSLWTVGTFLRRHREQVWSSSKWSFMCGRARTPPRCAWANISMSGSGGGGGGRRVEADRVAQHPSLIHYLFQLKVLWKGFFLFFSPKRCLSSF